ncbi:hypothetical protein ACLKA6_015964 [Drosophila palustris]
MSLHDNDDDLHHHDDDDNDDEHVATVWWCCVVLWCLVAFEPHYHGLFWVVPSDQKTSFSRVYRRAQIEQMRQEEAEEEGQRFVLAQDTDTIAWMQMGFDLNSFLLGGFLAPPSTMDLAPPPPFSRPLTKSAQLATLSMLLCGARCDRSRD